MLGEVKWLTTPAAWKGGAEGRKGEDGEGSDGGAGGGWRRRRGMKSRERELGE